MARFSGGLLRVPQLQCACPAADRRGWEGNTEGSRGRRGFSGCGWWGTRMSGELNRGNKFVAGNDENVKAPETTTAASASSAATVEAVSFRGLLCRRHGRWSGRLRSRRDRQRLLGGLHLVDRRLHLDVELLVGREPGARRNEPAHDHVFLQAAQVVDPPGDRRLGEHLGGLLERGGGDERLRRERRLGDAEQQRLAYRRLASRGRHSRILVVEHLLLHLLVDEEVGVAHLLDAHAAQHLPDDGLDVLVVDLHALEPVDLLHLVHHVARQLLLAEHFEDVVRVGGPVHERISGLHPVAGVHVDVLALCDQVLLRQVGAQLAVDLRRDHHLALALGVLPEADHALDLADDGVLLRLAGLEQLGHAGQTAGDVLGLGRLPRNAGDHLAGLDGIAVVHRDVGAHRQVVAGGGLGPGQVLRIAFLVLDADARLRLGVAALDDRLAGEAGDLVELLVHGHALDDVREADGAAHLGDDGRRERVPLRELGADLDLLAFLHVQLGAVDDVVALALAAVLIGDHQLAVAVHDDGRAVLALDRLQRVEVHHARVPVFDGARFRAPRGRAADVEGAHGELRTRLTDRLRGDHAHRLADVHLPAARQVAAVALDADAAPGLAGEYRADLHLLQAGFLDLADLVLVDLLVGPEEDLVGEGILDVVERDAAQDALAHRLDDLAAFHQGAERDPVHGPAVVLGDDGILRHIHQAPREVAGVGRLQRRVGEALAGPVRGDEVLQDGEALAEVRRDGGLDDLAGGLRHQAAHARQLADLLRGAAGAGVGHDEDRVEARLLLLLAVPLHRLGADLAHHLAGHLLGDLRPDVDHLVVPLAVGDQALEVLVLDLGHFLLSAIEHLLLLGRDDHVLDGDGDAGLGGIAVPEAAQPVGQEHRLLLAAEAVADVDQVPQRLLVHHLVDGAERDLLGEDVAEQHAADGGLDARPAGFFPVRIELVHAAGDLGLQVDLVVIVRRPHLGRRGEDAPFTVRQHPLAGQVVEPEDDVLAGHDERLEQLEGHDLRQAALVQLQLGANHDHAAAGVVDALAEQVLAETSLLALEHVGERLQRPLVGAGDGLAAAAVVEQRVDRLLQHALLVPDDDVWSVELLQALQAVVAVDHAPVQVIEVGGREPAAVERHQRTQIRRDHRDHVQHHPLGAVSALQEGVDHLQPLRQLLALGVAGRLLHLLAELVGELVDVDLLEQLDHRLAAHPGGEGVLTELFQGLVVLVLGEELAANEGRLLRVHHHVALP